MRITCYKKVLRMKPSALSDIKTGDIIRTINNDTAEFHHNYTTFRHDDFKRWNWNDSIVDNCSINAMGDCDFDGGNYSNFCSSLQNY